MIAQLCSAQTLAHSPALRRREPQKYTYSYHSPKNLNVGFFTKRGWGPTILPPPTKIVTIDVTNEKLPKMQK